MRLLIFSDLHSNEFSDFARTLPDGMNSRLKDCLDVLDAIPSIYDKYKCDGLVFNGDMFHLSRSVPTTTFEPTYRKLERLSEKVGFFVCVAGNHDLTSYGSSVVSSVYAANRLLRTRVVLNKATTIELDTKTAAHILPYIKLKDKFDSEYGKLLDRCRSSKYKNNIVFVHCDVDEAVNGPNEIRIKGKLSVRSLSKFGVDFVFCGHHHHPQKLSSNVWVIGAPIHHNMLDRGSLGRGVIVYDTLKKEAVRVPLKFSRFFMYEFDDVYSLNDFIRNPLPDVKGGYLRLVCRFNPSANTLFELENTLSSCGLRGSDVKIRKRVSVDTRNKKLTESLSREGFVFDESIDSYVKHVAPEGLNLDRLSRIGRRLITEHSSDAE